MKQKSKNGEWLFSINLSHFTNHQGEYHLSISKHGTWGGKYADGKYYITSMIMDGEKNIIRNYSNVPENIMKEALSFFDENYDAVSNKSANENNMELEDRKLGS